MAALDSLLDMPNMVALTGEDFGGGVVVVGSANDVFTTYRVTQAARGRYCAQGAHP